MLLHDHLLNQLTMTIIVLLMPNSRIENYLINLQLGQVEMAFAPEMLEVAHIIGSSIGSLVSCSVSSQIRPTAFPRVIVFRYAEVSCMAELAQIVLRP
jgi:hypothetical protein